MERGISLIIIGTFLQIELLNLCRRDITVVYFQLTILLLIENMIIVKDRLHLNLCFIREHITTIGRVFIDWYITVLGQFKDVGKQIDLTSLRFYWIIKSCIGILHQIQFAIDIPSPHNLLWHLKCRRK